MLEGQTNIFEMIYPTYKINKPIRLIEFFAGYGSQALALKYLGVEFEHWKICEWAIKSIQAYKDIHFTHTIDTLELFGEQSSIEYLYSKGISSNYNEPMTIEQVRRISYKERNRICSNIIITNNLVNIQQVKGKDLEIVDTDKYDYILTYSFPCQDLSLAGKGKGMSDTSTRSGMLWEVERILTECKELGTLPQILLMENVPQVHGADNVEDFNKWQLRLEELGYKNYWQDLIATDYGIPQTRNRCFMVSILGDYNYTFPKPIPLKLKLKDMLEDQVDEKYFLSEKMINYICSRMPTGDNKITTGINMGNKKEMDNAGTITTGEGSKPSSNYIIDNDDYDYSKEKGKIIRIKNATAKGYLEATDGDGIDLTQPNSETRRGRVQKDAIQTLTTQNNLGVCVNMKTELCNNLIKDGKVKENDVIRHSYTTSRMNGDMKDLKQNNISPTLDTRCDCLGVVNNMRIRKLTPRECFRLMGVKDEDFERCAKNQSDSSLYHLAGDSIVVNVLMAIFKELL